MNAVNLLPSRSGGRGRRLPAAGSVPFLSMIAVLVLILAGTVMYVSANNRVSSRQSELTGLTAGVNQWSAVANSYTRFSTESTQHTEELTDVRQLAAGRFDWSNLLGQLSALMPADAQLSSLQATTPGSAASSESTTSAASGTTSGSTIQVSACATSQSAVAQTMVQLRRITDVASVTLSSSTSGGGSSGASSGGGCSLPVAFSLSLAFVAPAPTATAGTAEGTNAADTTTTASSTASTGSTSSAS